MPADTEPPELEFLVRDVARLMRRRFEQCGQELGLLLTRAQCFVLVHIGREPGLSQARLAQLMDIEPIALVRLIDRLQAETLVERRLDPKDRRVWRLYLTDRAAPTLERIGRISAAVTQRALANLPQPEHGALMGTLRQIKASLSSGAPLLQQQTDRSDDGSLALAGG